MSIHQHATLADTVYLWFAANDTSGSGGDGASPVYDVRLAGAAAGAAPVLSGSATLLTHANFPDGAHEVAIAATAGNGFAATNTYAVFCTLLVDSQNPTGFIGSFTLGPIVANLTEMGGVAQSAIDLKDFADAGYDPGTNKVQGVVLVDTTTTNTDMRGTDNAALAATALSTAVWTSPADLVDLVWDELLTGASHNIATSAGRRLRQVESIFVLDTGTAQAGAAGSITLAAGADANDVFYIHTMIVITAGTGVGQVRAVQEYNGTTKVATTVPNWVVTPDATSDYEVLADTEKHVFQVEANAITAASFATDAVDSNALAADAANEIADAALVRGASNIEGSADRHSLGALIMITTNASIVGTTLTAKKPSNDAPFATYTITVDASADPATGIS